MRSQRRGRVERGPLPLNVVDCNRDLLLCGIEATTCASEYATCEDTLEACANGCACPQSSQLPRTGQISAYGAGSDGATQRGLVRSFTDNGDGTITGNVTGLMWEKKSDDGSIHDKDSRYTWGMTSAPYTMNGTMVTTFLADLNSGVGFAGHTDWQIPNRMELESLVNVEVVAPAAFSEFNNACSGGCTVTTCSCMALDDHWPSTTYRAFPGDAAWGVSFLAGNTQANLKTYDFSVRAVRGGA